MKTIMLLALSFTFSGAAMAQPGSSASDASVALSQMSDLHPLSRYRRDLLKLAAATSNLQDSRDLVKGLKSIDKTSTDPKVLLGTIQNLLAVLDQTQIQRERIAQESNEILSRLVHNRPRLSRSSTICEGVRHTSTSADCETQTVSEIKNSATQTQFETKTSEAQTTLGEQVDASTQVELAHQSRFASCISSLKNKFNKFGNSITAMARNGAIWFKNIFNRNKSARAGR